MTFSDLYLVGPDLLELINLFVQVLIISVPELTATVNKIIEDVKIFGTKREIFFGFYLIQLFVLPVRYPKNCIRV